VPPTLGGRQLRLISPPPPEPPGRPSNEVERADGALAFLRRVRVAGFRATVARVTKPGGYIRCRRRKAPSSGRRDRRWQPFGLWCSPAPFGQKHCRLQVPPGHRDATVQTACWLAPPAHRMSLNPVLLHGRFAVSEVDAVVAGLKRMLIVPRSPLSLPMPQSTLGLPKNSVGPPPGGFGRQGWSMFGPQLQIGSVTQVEPGAQSALSPHRLRHRVPRPPHRAEAAADRQGCRVATREGARVLAEAGIPRRSRGWSCPSRPP
jgi:hypothetical protein